MADGGIGESDLGYVPIRYGAWKDYGPACAICATTIPFHLAGCCRVISEYHGGTDDDTNLRPICETCRNMKKRDIRNERMDLDRYLLDNDLAQQFKSLLLTWTPDLPRITDADALTVDRFIADWDDEVTEHGVKLDSTELEVRFAYDFFDTFNEWCDKCGIERLGLDRFVRLMRTRAKTLWLRCSGKECPLYGSICPLISDDEQDEWSEVRNISQSCINHT